MIIFALLIVSFKTTREMFKFSISLKFRLYDNDKQNKKKGCVSPQFFLRQLNWYSH